MAHRTATNVGETCTTAGTGAKSLAGAITGMKRVSAMNGMTIGDTLTLLFQSVDGSGNKTTEWECGIYTYTAANQVTLAQIIGSSNSGSPTAFSGATLQVFNAPLAELMLHIDPENKVNLPLSTGTTTAPASGVSIMARTLAGRVMVSMIGPSGMRTLLQPSIARNRFALWSAAGNSTTISAVGAAALSATGTATAANVAVTNQQTRTRRIEYLVTTAATTAVAGYRGGIAPYWLSSTAGQGGLSHVTQFAPATGVTVSTRRCFNGMTSSTAAPTDVQPSSLTNMFGVGYDAADTNWQIMHNDASGTATKVDTGIVRPSADRTDFYEIAIFAAPGSYSVIFEFTDLTTGTSFTHTATTDLPAANTLLAPRGYTSVGGTSAVTGIALSQKYIETDN